MNHSRWNLLPPAPDEYLNGSTGYYGLLAQLLYNRGLNDPSQMELFLVGDERLSGDPFLLSDMNTAVSRIYRALLSAEKIAVYGDFDVDGVTSTALMVQGLASLGGVVIPYIPHRITEGHGLRLAAIQELRDQGVSLIITVDCGITDIEEVRYANKQGITVIITDHHTPPATVPPAFAIVNPKLASSEYPFNELAGVGVAYKVLEALMSSLGKEDQIEAHMDLVAIGTVADMVPLVSENRYLVKRGIRTLNTNPRLGIREIITRAGLSAGNLDADSITWCLSPWLNASGRLEHAIASYNLLTTTSPQEAHELAALLGQQNIERQRLTAKAMMEARQQIGSQGLAPLIMLCNKEFPLGIAGPVAGKLSEEYYRPVIIINIDDKTASGSSRSIPEFNIINALNQCAGLLGRYGGHAQAAGFTLPSKNIPMLQKALIEIAAGQLKDVDLRPRINIDAEVSLSELDSGAYQQLQKLAPFGKGNPVPTFISRAVQVAACRTMGNEQQHLRLKLKQNGSNFDGVAFKLGDSLSDVSSFLDIVYNLEIDRWSGMENLRLNILSFIPNQDSSRTQAR
ncbi:MAG: single-stranded-DNA-specific exonuclease RecJ [Dehalococcoidales bacterium]|nr:single-stranded-DNA-specific exonuclease RecJ [Dehalococcoidales bacterium]